MALGNNYRNNGNQGNNGNQMWEPSYYSRLRIKNPEQRLYVSFAFWKGTLRVSINESAGQSGQSNELAYIHLSPTKARIMADAVNRIIQTDKDGSYGVDTGAGETHGFIAIGRDHGIPYLFIAKVDGNGRYESSQRFDFTNNYNYILNVHDISQLKCQKEYMNTVELDQFHDILEDYARCASGAMGASFYDIGRYEAAKASNMMRKIAGKVGVEFGNGNGGNGYNGGGNRYNNNNSYNGNNNYSNGGNNGNSNNGNNNHSRYDSIDDLEDALG